MRVFISSTSEDLTAYRKAARDVVQELGWQPVMMEYFGTDGRRKVLDACLHQLDGVDVVLAILAWRLGGVPDPERGGDGKRSYTQWEIDTALDRDKPVLVLMAGENWPGNRWERDPDRFAQVQGFRGELDRLAVFFEAEAEEADTNKSLPIFRSIVREELVRHQLKEGKVVPVPTTLQLRQWQEPKWPDRPYPLLLPYSHPALLAGREWELAEVRRRLRLPVAILGLYAPSGAGKSSLLEAGLVPALRAEGLAVSLVRTPQDPGLARLLIGDLLEMETPEEEDEHPALTPERARFFVRHLLAARRLADSPPVLVLDQFEDLLRRPEARAARATLGMLLAASVQRQPGLADPLCRWLLAYRQEFHGEVMVWLRDPLREAREEGLTASLPGDLTEGGRFDSWPLPPLGTAPAGADAQAVARRAFLDAITRPLALPAEEGEDGALRYPWRFAGDGAERLAAAFAAARVAHPEAPLVPELQVVLAHLLQAAGEPTGGEPAEIRVPEEPEKLLGEALEAHLRKVLEAIFPAGRGEESRSRRTHALLALRELADAHGRRGEGVSASRLAPMIGEGGEKVLEDLAAAGVRLVVPHGEPEGVIYTLSHDRLAEVIVRLVDEEGGPLHLDVDRELLALRRFVALNTELYQSGEEEQATSLPRAHYRRIRLHAQALLSDEARRRWWAACQRRRRGQRRRAITRWSVAAALVALLVTGAVEMGRQRSERQELLQQLRLGTPANTFDALYRLRHDHEMDPKELAEKLAERQGGVAEVFGQGVSVLPKEEWSTEVLSATELVLAMRPEVSEAWRRSEGWPGRWTTSPPRRKPPAPAPASCGSNC